MNEIVTRRSFLDRRACIESTLRLKFVKDQEVSLYIIINFIFSNTPVITIFLFLFYFNNEFQFITITLKNHQKLLPYLKKKLVVNK